MEETAELNLSDLFKIIKKRFFSFVSLVCIVLLVTLGVSIVIPPIYKSSAKIIVQNETNLYPDGIIPKTSDDATYLKTQREILSSSFIIENALKTLQKNGTLQNFDYDQIKKKISAQYLNDSNLLELNVYLNNKTDSAELANEIVKSFINYNSNSKLELITKSLDILNNETDLLKKDIGDLELKLKELQDKEQLNYFQAQIPYYVSNILDINKKTAAAEADIERIKTELKKTNTAIGKEDLFYTFPLTPSISGQNTGENPTSSLTTIPWIQYTKMKLSEAKAKLSKLTVDFTDEHPEVIGARNEVVLLQNTLDKELEKILKTYSDYYDNYIAFLENNKKSNALERVQNQNQLNNISSNINIAASKQIEFNLVLKTLDAIKEIQAIFLRKQNELKVLKDQFSVSNLPNISIFELAKPPLKPAFPNLPLNLSLGLILGIFIGISGTINAEKKSSQRPERVRTNKTLKPQSPQKLYQEEPKYQDEEMVQEKRVMERSSRAFVVAYETEENKKNRIKQYTVSENISGTGIGIKLKELLSEGAELSLKTILSDKNYILTKGKVVWIKPAKEKNMFDAGIHFTNINPKDREKLVSYLSETNQ